MKYRKKKIRNIPLGILKHLIFSIWSVLTIFPIVFMIITALKTKDEYSYNKLGFPIDATLSNIKEILFETNFGRWFLNSLIITVFTIILSLALGILAAYVLNKVRFKFKSPFINIIVSLIVIPPIIMIVPLYVFLVRVNLTNNYFGISLVFIGILLPFCIYTLLGFFKTIPRSLTESAIVDGASSFRILINIIIPLSAPAIGTLAVVNAIYVWNDLLISIIIMQKEKMRTLIGGLIMFASRYNLQIPLLMTGLALSTIPIIILYFLTQRYFIQGLTSGAIKG